MTSLESFPPEILLQIVRHIIQGHIVESHNEPFRGFIGYYEWNLITPRDVLNFSATSQRVQSIIYSSIFRNFGAKLIHNFHLFKCFDFSLPRDSFLNYSAPPNFLFTWEASHIPKRVLRNVRHLILIFIKDESGVGSPSPSINLINQQNIPRLKEITIHLDNSYKYDELSLQTLGAELKKYTDVVSVHLIITIIHSYDGMPFLDLLNFNELITTFQVQAHPTRFGKSLARPLSSFINLKKLAFKPGKLDATGLHTSNVLTPTSFTSEVGKYTAGLRKLEEVEFLLNFRVEERVDWQLGPNVECLTIDLYNFLSSHSSPTRFDSVTHLELDLHDNSPGTFCKLPFRNLESLQIEGYQISLMTFDFLKELVDANPRLINLGFYQLDLKDYQSLLPLLSNIHNLELGGYESWDFSGPDVPENPANLILDNAPKLRSVFMPLFRYGMISMQLMIEAISRNPELATLHLDIGYTIQPPSPLNFFSDCDTLDTLLPSHVQVSDFCYPVKVFEIDPFSPTCSYLIDMEKLHRLLKI